MEPNSAADHRIEPEFLGPLGDRPLAESAGRSTPGDLFPGAAKFLSQRQQAKRREQWNAVRPMVKRLLTAGEHVLHVAYAQQVPPFMHCIGLGHFVYAYHQVVLVVTDQRIIEVLLNFRANGPGTRMRSWPLRSLKALKQSFGKLTAVPGQGRKQGWRVRLRGDRKLLALLLPRLQPRLFAEGAGHSEPSPLWHCPRCGAGVRPEPEDCASCRTRFRSTRMATMLSLAFPGAGLFYLGHPFLAASDFLGETMLFAIWVAMMVGSSASDGPMPALLVGGLFFALTKIESIHVGRVLGARSIPEPEGRRERLVKLAVAGGALSALLVAGAFPLAASARPRLEHDLDLANASDWSVSRRAADWVSFKDDTSARSQWTHAPTGAHLTVFAYPQSLLDDPEEFHRSYAARMQKQSVRTLVDDTTVPAPFHGFRYVADLKGKSGQEVALVSYFLYDQDGHDIHHLSLAVPIDDAQAADALVQDFVRHAKFVDALPPQR
ncbi:MAG TPA: hypothetical protein VFB49_07815 [Patescibacteria group bacterium]|nr:hypothetical protein [Patescibacteria group bacterium]